MSNTKKCDRCLHRDEINEILIREYISKVKCCDECFASVYCTVNGLRESRMPQDYCVKNIKRYFGDKVKPVDEKSQGKTNADLFKQTFGLYATEVWAMSESQFLEWLNSKNDCKEADNDT